MKKYTEIITNCILSEEWKMQKAFLFCRFRIGTGYKKSDSNPLIDGKRVFIPTEKGNPVMKMAELPLNELEIGHYGILPKDHAR